MKWLIPFLTSRKTDRTPRRLRPGVQALEDRRVPSTGLAILPAGSTSLRSPTTSATALVYYPPNPC